MDLKFSITELQKLLDISREQTAKYSEAINTIDINIKKLENKLKTTETKIYQTLVEKYNSKKLKLYQAKEEMTKFCDLLTEKITELTEATQDTKNSFE